MGPLFVIMSTLLLPTSGVAILERTIARRRPGYEAYAEATNALLPWRPRSMDR